MLLAIHGFTEIDLSWTEVLQDLNLPVEGYVLPGHGHKPCLEGTTHASVAEVIHRRFADREPFDLLGYSMGGRVALQFALTYPQLVRRLILVSCRPGIKDDAKRERRKAEDEGLAMMLEENGIGQFVAWWENNPALKPTKPYSRSTAEHIRSRRLSQDHIGLAGCLRGLGQGSSPSLWDRLGELSMPCLAIAGEADETFVQEMGEMVEALPKGKLAVVPESGHAVHRESKDSLVNIVRGFLASKVD